MKRFPLVFLSAFLIEMVIGHLLFARELERPFYHDRGIYIDNGYSFALLVASKDTDVLEDGLWIDTRIGYLWKQDTGVHLDGGYFISSLRNSKNTRANYFRIGLGLKNLFPFGESRYAGFLDTMIGYDRISISDSSNGNSISKSGVAIGVDGGITLKVSSWFGMSPYLGIRGILGSISGGVLSSYWFTSGLMVHFFF